MRRKLNFTGRRKLTRAMVSLSISEISGKQSVSCSTKIPKRLLSEGSSRIILEAHAGALVARRELGTIDQPLSLLNDTQLLQNIGGAGRFSVKVLAANSANILAAAYGLLPEDSSDGDQKALLPIVVADIAVPWRVSFADEGDDTNDGPVLYVSDKVPGGTTRLQNDELFLALVLPAVVERVAHEVVSEGRPTESWKAKWYKAILTELAGDFGGIQPEEDGFEAEQSEWAERCAEEFTKKFLLIERWSSLIAGVEND